MKNEVKKTTESESYYTEEILTKIRELTEEGMEKVLLELEDTHYWIAILRYVQARTIFAQQALSTLDPFKEPTLVARHQGLVQGLIDLQEGVISLKNKSKKK